MDEDFKRSRSNGSEDERKGSKRRLGEGKRGVLTSKFKEYLHMYEDSVKRYKELEHKLIDEKKKYEHLYQEKEEIKSGAKELLERVKKETTDKENLVCLYF